MAIMEKKLDSRLDSLRQEMHQSRNRRKSQMHQFRNQRKKAEQQPPSQEIEKAISARNEKKRNEGLERWLQSFKEGIHQRITAPLPSTFASNQEIKDTEPKPTVFDQRDSMDDQLHQEDEQRAVSVILPIQNVAEETEFIGPEVAEEKEHTMADKSTEIHGSISCYEFI
ncbi:hypothetical protein F2Q69_00034225 [Brassica cretica]|uniref:Uncharacterized protein n=1 Tax=Brassica cretica TaxID=69181 RepID=A0A8S9SQU7_BRACR|nr:hypothetical protein F2Q69_00034225 [Brassica cretica]